jgi:uncharacterized membrane protein
MAKSIIKDVDHLVAAGVIDRDTAERIRQYYDHTKPGTENRFATVLFIAGALLVGSGIVLIVAHNWDMLSPHWRTFFALLPLAVAQSLCLYAFIKRKNSQGWLESSAVLLFFAVGTGISLISQIYHISGSLGGFLLTWILLTLPLVYLLSSSVVALLLIGTITWYASLEGYGANNIKAPFIYLLLMLSLLPHYYIVNKRRPDSNSIQFFHWFSCISVIIVLGTFAIELMSVTWIFIAYIALFLLLHVTGRSILMREKRLVENPFLLIGALGILFCLFLWSYDSLWTSRYGSELYGKEIFSSPLLYVTIGIILFSLWQIAEARKSRSLVIHPLEVAALLCSVFLFSFYNNPYLGIVCVNLTVLYIAVYYIRKGSLENHLGILNFGLIIFMLLAIFRFFDDSIAFVWRGLFFVITGVSFFTANYLLLRRRKQIKQIQETR